MKKWILLLVFLSLPTMAADVATKTVQANSGKVVLLDFWASWCGPCKKSFPWMNEMHKKYSSKGLKIIAVNLDQERPLADKFLKESPAKFEVIYDPSGASAEKHNVQAMPSSFLFSRAGKIEVKHLGFETKKQAQYEKEIIKLLGEVK